MAVAMAQDRRPRHFAVGPVLRRLPPLVALARQRRLEFRLQKLFDEGADAHAHPGLQRIKLISAGAPNAGHGLLNKPETAGIARCSPTA